MRDYTIFYKDSFDASLRIDLGVSWDIFISTYILDERVRRVFKAVSAKKKYWLEDHVYDLKAKDCPVASRGIEVFKTSGSKETESEFIARFIKSLNIDWMNTKFCIDITGFTGSTLIFLLYYLKYLGVRRFDAIYSEPDYYLNREETIFSDQNVIEVKQVEGCEGKHITDNSNDVLIIGIGYDYSLINQVAESKKFSQKIKVFGFPSLKADMYQESILQFHKASEAIGSEMTPPNGYCAPAYDPFVTASIIRKIIDDLQKGKGFKNIYLCPLGTKAQILGFSLFYLTECIDSPISIIYPYCLNYNNKHSVGLTKIWKYTIEF